MFEKYKKVIIASIVIIVLFILYAKFIKPDTETSLLTSVGTGSAQSSADLLGADIIRAINQINALELDISIFNHPILLKLVDRTNFIEPQPVGRRNPFAPLGENETMRAISDRNDESENGENGAE